MDKRNSYVADMAIAEDDVVKICQNTVNVTPHGGVDAGSAVVGEGDVVYLIDCADPDFGGGAGGKSCFAGALIAITNSAASV